MFCIFKIMTSMNVKLLLNVEKSLVKCRQTEDCSARKAHVKDLHLASLCGNDGPCFKSILSQGKYL